MLLVFDVLIHWTLVERACQLAEVAAEGVAVSVEAFGHGTGMMGIVVGGAAGDVKHGRTIVSEGLVGACFDAAVAGGAR